MLATAKSPHKALSAVRALTHAFTGLSKFHLAAEFPFGRHNQQSHYMREEI